MIVFRSYSITGEGGKTDLQTVLASTCTQHGTVLHYAVQAGLTVAVRALLLAGADPGIQSDSGATALDMVAHNPALLQVFADELLRAVAASNCERAEVLLDASVTIGAEDSVLTKNSSLGSQLWISCSKERCRYCQNSPGCRNRWIRHGN